MGIVGGNMKVRFDLTYEGLKFGKVRDFLPFSPGFDLTYEGLKFIIDLLYRYAGNVLILPMRD